MRSSSETLKTAILSQATFVRAIFSGPDKKATHPWRKIIVRPVVLKAGFRWQISRFDAAKDITKNFDHQEVGAVVDELLGLRFRNVEIEGIDQTLTATLTGSEYRLKEKVHETPKPAAPATHDRKKNTILDADHPAPFLGMLGFVTADGRLKADKRDKFVQINEFLRILEETGAYPARGTSFKVVDFGCGNAYLTFALYHRLANDLGIAASLTGVDLKNDLIGLHQGRAASLGWSGMHFETGTIGGFTTPTPPDAVVALHACDTATDDAIAQGIHWGSQLIVVAPCCHHNLQAQLDRSTPPGVFAPVFRYGLTSERQADLLTDTFRALLLRIHGYKTDILQFVDPSHTPKNLMIRAVKTTTPAPESFHEEYRAMKEFWGVVPYLETRMGELTTPPS